jgi:hypothetical protein
VDRARHAARLPAYYAWTFRTGEAGDFESLAKRLHAVQLTRGERTPCTCRPSGTAELAVDWEAPLRVRGQVEQRPGARGGRQRDPHALRGGTNPPIRPSYFGELDGRARWRR